MIPAPSQNVAVLANLTWALTFFHISMVIIGSAHLWVLLRTLREIRFFLSGMVETTTLIVTAEGVAPVETTATRPEGQP